LGTTTTTTTTFGFSFGFGLNGLFLSGDYSRIGRVPIGLPMTNLLGFYRPDAVPVTNQPSVKALTESDMKSMQSRLKTFLYKSSYH